MTKFLFCSMPYRSHITPTLPIVQELIARGAEVAYCSKDDEFKNAIQSTGATILAYEYPTATSGPVMSGIGTFNRCYYILERMLDETRRCKPDYIIYDAMCLWARLLAQILKIPAVKLHTTYALNKYFHPFDSYVDTHANAEDIDFIPEVRYAVEKLCTTYNLQPFDYADFYWYAEPLNIVFIPRIFQPLAGTFDRRFKFVGPSIIPRDEDRDFPLDKFGTQPVLYISLGSVVQDIPSFYDICLTAFGHQPCQVIIVVGDNFHRDSYGPIPENIAMFAHVPQLAVLQHTDIFITPGGMNSVMEALYYAVPMVVIPFRDEQMITAKRVEKLGLGIVGTSLRSTTAHKLRQSIIHVEKNLDRFRANAQRLRNTVLEGGGYRSAVDAIMKFSNK